MKIIVISDSHGSAVSIENVIYGHPEAQYIVFLGDGERDFEEALAVCGIFPYGSDRSKTILQVRGNCDRMSSEAVTLTESFGRVKMLITHGFDQGVKYTLSKLVLEAKEKGCKAALFGHTHKQCLEERDGITLFNPGSVRSGYYGLITVAQEQAEFELCEL